MSEAGTVFKTFNLVTKDGKQRVLPRPNIATEKAVGVYLERRESAFLSRNRKDLGEAYQDMLRMHLANGTNNWFGWCRPGFVDAMNDPSNVAYLFFEWIGQVYSRDDANETLAVTSKEDAYKLYMDNQAAFDAVLQEAINDPNPLAP